MSGQGGGTRVRLARGDGYFRLEARGHSCDEACCNYITGVLYALAGYCHRAAGRGEAELLDYEARAGLMRLSARGGPGLSAALEAAELGLRLLAAHRPGAVEVEEEEEDEIQGE